ncbi:MAG: glucosamine inositolphosphorylceramide transferase family protein [Acidimicrobiales bacterium]
MRFDETRARVRAVARYASVEEMWSVHRIRWNPADGPIALQSAIEQARPALPAKSDVFYADPFQLPNGHLIVEEYDFSVGYGTIVEFDGPHRRVLLDDKIHSSYPFVISNGETTVVIPERAASGVLTAFTYVEGQTLTPRYTSLPGLQVVDPTLLHHDNHWYLFHSRTDTGPADELHLMFTKDDLFGFQAPRWSDHPLSPVLQLPDRARPGGGPIVNGDQTLLPLQDCSTSYGGQLQLWEVLDLSPETIQMRPHSDLAPPTWATGTHTLAPTAAADEWLVDTKEDVFLTRSGAVARHRLGLMTRKLSWRTGTAH